MRRVGVIDIGKTNAKVLVFGPDGDTLYEVSTPNAARHGWPYPHADVAGLWGFMVAALAAVPAPHKPTCLVVTAHGATAALVDDEGLVLPILDYEFPAIEACEAEYATVRPPFEETFSPRMGNGLNVGRQMFWQQRHYPAEFSKAKHVLMYPQYWGWRLTGVKASEVTSLGCHTDLWQPVAGKPSRLVAEQGWEGMLPPLKQASEVLGMLLPEIAAATGLPDSTPVLTGIHDSNASLLPYLITESSPFTVVSSGTWVVVMAVGTPLDRLDPQVDMLANVNALGQPVACAKFMGGREYQTLLGSNPPSASYQAMVSVIESGAMALPSFAPLGGPYAGHRGRVIGSLPTHREAQAALAALYLALMTDDLLRRLGVISGPIIVDGHLASNGLFAAVLADLRGSQPIIFSKAAAGTAFGASLLADFPKRQPHRAFRVVKPALLPGLADYQRRWIDLVQGDGLR